MTETASAAEDQFRQQFQEAVGIEPEGEEAPEASEVEAEVAAPEVQPEPVPEPDDDVQRFVEHHGGGDPQKALAAAAAMQRERGATQQELGELRQIVAQIQEQTAPDTTYVDEATQSWFEQTLAENPHGAIEWARQNQQPELFQYALREWYASDPQNATEYRLDLNNRQMFQVMQQQNAGAQDLVRETEMAQAMYQVAGRYPEFADDQTVERLMNDTRFTSFINTTIAPGLQGNAQQKQAALEQAAIYARGLGLTAAATPEGEPAAPVNGNAPVAPTAATLAQQARVATGSYSPSRGTPSKEEQGRALFRQIVGITEDE